MILAQHVGRRHGCGRSCIDHGRSPTAGAARCRPTQLAAHFATRKLRAEPSATLTDAFNSAKSSFMTSTVFPAVLVTHDTVAQGRFSHHVSVEYGTTALIALEVGHGVASMHLLLNGRNGLLRAYTL